MAAELTAGEVQVLLERAAAASASNDAVIAVVDRNGTLLGAQVEGGIAPQIATNPILLVYAVDGALAEARGGAMFANDTAPITSRTVGFIAQSTVTQREVESIPSITDEASPLRGPGFVAPVGVNAHFPPDVNFTPAVDLFGIENTNRDSLISPGPDRVMGTADDVTLPSRFNVDPAYVAPGANMPAPESYGQSSGFLPGSVSRGIGTLPGGVPLYKDGHLVGGIGVFFPGTTGFATAENSRLNDGLYNPWLPDRSMEAEAIAFAAAGGSRAAGVPVGPIGGVPALPGFDLPFGRIDLVGVTLDIYGPNGLQGPQILAAQLRQQGVGNPFSGVYLPINVGPDGLPFTADDTYFQGGTPAPSGWLVVPHDGVGLTAADVEQIVAQGVIGAMKTRAQLRLPLDNRTRMVFAVTDTTGAVLGLYRMPDAATFSINVSVSKGRNTAYYANPTLLQPIDRVPGIPPGTALSSRSIRFLALPYYPDGQDTYPPGPFSILNDGGTLGRTALRAGFPLPASAFQSVLGYDAFHPNTNFRDPANLQNQSGVVFFPGGVPLYKDVNGDGVPDLVGGLGVSGDGVDEDDVVTAFASQGYGPPPTVPRSDQVIVRGIRVPYLKFNRNPLG